MTTETDIGNHPLDVLETHAILRRRLAVAMAEESPMICETWLKQLRADMHLLETGMANETTSPVRPLLESFLQTMIGKLRPEGAEERLREHEGYLAWQRLGLCRAVKVLQAGEQALRRWTRQRVQASDAEMFTLLEIINDTFHQFERSRVLSYCEQCRALRAAKSPGKSAEGGGRP